MKKLLQMFIIFFVALPAWAGQGWYLITPPGMKGENGNQPLSKWDQLAAFEKAQDCETAKINAFDKAQHEMLEASIPGDIKDKAATLENFQRKSDTFMAFAASRCIASDDPRLK